MLIVIKAAIIYRHIFQLIVVSAVKDCNGTGPLSAIFVRLFHNKRGKSQEPILSPGAKSLHTQPEILNFLPKPYLEQIEIFIQTTGTNHKCKRKICT